MRSTTVRTAWILATLIVVLAPDAHATIWGAKSLAPGGSAPSSAPTNLFRFEEDLSGGVTDLGTIQNAGGTALDADALAISAADGLLGYALGASGAQLVSIDTSTATATPIGAALAGRDIRGAAFIAGSLYVVDAASDELLEIDPATGAPIGSALAITLGGGGFDVSTGCDLAVDAAGVAYLVSFGKVFTIDVTTGAATLQFDDTTPGEGCGANPVFHVGATFSAAAAPDTLFTFEANCTDDLYSYDIDSGYPRSLLVSNILGSFNAGRGDLASLVPPVSVPLQNAASLTALAGALLTLLAFAALRRGGS